MEEPWNEPHESIEDAAAELRSLQATQRELWATLRREDDPELRMLLLSRFGENRAAIEQLSRGFGLEPEPGTNQEFRVEIVDEPEARPPAARQIPPSALPFGDGPSIPPPPPRTDRTDRTSPSAGTPSSARPLLAGAQQVPTRVLVVGGALIALLGLAWLLVILPFGDSSGPDGSSNLTADTLVASPSATDDRFDEIAAVLRELGLNGVAVEERDSVLYLEGTVASEAERQSALGAARALAGEVSIDDSGLSVLAAAADEAPAVAGRATGRPEAFQTEINRVVASTPIIFGSGDTTLTELHLRILNTVVSIMSAYPDLPVMIVGFTDDTGSDEGNRQLSLARADSVRAYLVSQGVPESQLGIEPRGEETSSGSRALANLERRVEFEVVVPAGAAVNPNDSTLRVAIVAPSARNDLAFTQSMVDAVGVVAAERGNIEVSITDNTFVPEEAANAIRDYAAQGYDLVIAHGSQFGGPLLEIAPEYPEVAFAWGTASDTFGLPNVYAYDAAAGEGGYVLGAMSALLTQSGVVGVVGPIEVGDAQQYVDGFKAGAEAESQAIQVRVAYTGSFSDLTLAAETAQAHLDAGSDVMTGSAQMVVGAVSIASEAGALWFGTQSNQASLAPSIVVASQVYHWEVILRQIIGGLDAGDITGQTYTANLANGGLVIEYNPSFALPDPVRQRGDQIAEGIKNGSVAVAAG